MTAPLRLVVRRRELHPPGAEQRRVEISVRVPTDLGVVEETVDLVARHCLASGVTPRVARFIVRVALCEALANAIQYGNRLDPEKNVDVRVQVDDDALQVFVHDEGEGFDPTQIPNPTDPDRVNLEKGRGLFLIRQLMDEVCFNARGNSICMIMRRT